MEFVIFFAVLAAIVWAAWKIYATFVAEQEDELRQAWHTVLHDPNYSHRRQREETRYLRQLRAR